MYEFIEKLDDTGLLKENLDIMNHNLNTNQPFEPMQRFCTKLLYFANKKCNWIIVEKVSLGCFIYDDYFCERLESNDFHDIRGLKRLNSLGNNNKHDDVSDKKSLSLIPDYYKMIYSLSSKIYKLLTDEETEEKFDKQYLEWFMISDEERQSIYERDKLQMQERIQDLEEELETKSVTSKEALAINQELEILKKKDKRFIELDKQKDEKLYKLENEIKKLKDDLNSQKNENHLSGIAIHPTKFLNKKVSIQDEKEINAANYTLKQLKNSKKNIYGDFKFYQLVKDTLYYSTSYVDNDNEYMIDNIDLSNDCISEYESYYAVINNILQRGSYISKSPYLTTLNLSDKEYTQIIKYQLTLLALLKYGYLDDNDWYINLSFGNEDLLKIAAEDIFSYCRMFCGLSHREFKTPKLHICDNKTAQKDLVMISCGGTPAGLVGKTVFIKTSKRIIQSDSTNYNLWIAPRINYTITPSQEKDLFPLLEILFGFKNFNIGQFEIFRHFINGESTIGILPTGAGKSLIYQLTAMMQPKVCIVVDPINELMKDQVRSLQEKYKITRCCYINSEQNRSLIEHETYSMLHGNIQFVFISPERLQNKAFRDILHLTKEKNIIDSVILDEVHCLSEWGHDFRTSYLMLAHTLNNIIPDIKYLGLTATASINVIRDLMIELNIPTSGIKYNENLRRNNLKFYFTKFDSSNEKLCRIKTNLEKTCTTEGSSNLNAALIFTHTKGETTKISDELNAMDSLKNRVRYYNSSTKKFAKEFLDNKISVLVSTKAFGMGIDKPNIRETIHYDLPASWENYYQEAGRAGRDGNPASCYIYDIALDDDQQQCVESLLNENATITEFKTQLKYFHQIKKDSIESNFHFLASNLKEPNIEAIETYKLFELISANKNGQTSVLGKGIIHNHFKQTEWKLDGSDIKSFTEAKLYILHKVGIVNNWACDYSSGETYDILLYNSDPDFDFIKNTTINYLSQYDNYESSVDEINKLENIAQLQQLIYVVRAWYHEKFVKSRLRQIKNVYDKFNEWSNKDNSDEIQEYIENYFDLSNAFTTLAFRDSNNEILKVFDIILGIPPDKYSAKIAQAEHISESATNDESKLHLSLLHLLNNTFDNRDGAIRLGQVLNSYSEDKLLILMDLIRTKLLMILSQEQKEKLFDVLALHCGELFFEKLILKIDQQDWMYKYHVKYLNVLTKNIFEGEYNGR